LIAFHLSEKLSGSTVSEIAKHYGVKLAAMHVTLSRLRTRAKVDAEFADQLRNAETAVR